MTSSAHVALADTIAELLEARAIGRERSSSPRGGTYTLRSDGTAAVPSSSQRSTVAQLTATQPRGYVVSLRAIAEQGSSAGPTFPWARWIVQFGQAGALSTVEVDGYSDQALAVFGNFVRVDFEWDLPAIARSLLWAGVAPGLPRVLRGDAAISAAEGAVTTARRSIALNQNDPNPETVPVPYSATGVILRSAGAGWYAPGASLLWAPRFAAGGFVDNYLPADVTAAHARGEYMNVPSTADEVIVGKPPAPGAFPAFLEFLLEP